LVSADASQQELRWLAIFTRDPVLKEIYDLGLDMHSRVCCQIYGLNYEMFEEIRNHKGESAQETQENIKAILEKWAKTEDVKCALALYNQKYSTNYNDLTDESVVRLSEMFELLRKMTKTTVFGTIYGISAVGLSEQLEISKEEAQQLIDGFKAGLPYYSKWEAETNRKIMTEGFVETALGRKRRFGETIAEAMQDEMYKKRGYHWKIEKAKRQGGNAQIQGSSADQIKLAMVNMFYPVRPDGTRCFDREEWVREGYKSLLEKYDMYLVLQVHDEVIVDAPLDVPPEATQAIAECICNAIPNDVGISFKSDVEIGPYWSAKFSQEQLQQLRDGSLDWREVFEEEVRVKLAKFGIEYRKGMFEEVSEEEASVVLTLSKEGIEYIPGLIEDDEDEESEIAI